MYTSLAAAAEVPQNNGAERARILALSLLEKGREEQREIGGNRQTDFLLKNRWPELREESPLHE